MRWTGTSAPIELNRSGNYMSAEAFSVSADGSVATGRMYASATPDTDPTMVAFRWVSGLNTTIIPNAPGIDLAEGKAINGDGTVIVGLARGTPGGSYQTFRWTAASGTAVLVSGFGFGNLGVSTDGNKFCGSGAAGALLWSSGTSTPVGPASSQSSAISGDGNTVAGTSNAGVWTWSGGTTQFLATRLTALGVDLGGLVLTEINGASSNGKVLVGSVIRDNDFGEGYIAILP
ncbi:MAG: hypothetical protein H7X95_14585 [Deltaproteobacteria bacterium]|nr:hypothetical protein [Deltaproteobacteria bacterium]